MSQGGHPPRRRITVQGWRTLAMLAIAAGLLAACGMGTQATSSTSQPSSQPSVTTRPPATTAPPTTAAPPTTSPTTTVPPTTAPQVTTAPAPTAVTTPYGAPGDPSNPPTYEWPGGSANICNGPNWAQFGDCVPGGGTNGNLGPTYP